MSQVEAHQQGEHKQEALAPLTKEQHPLISIVMPVFNRERFLTQAIESILAQTYDRWELIVVDDGSRDNSVPLLKTLTANISQAVTLIEQENAGPAAARNAGIAKAEGEFIAFYDSDDVWFPHHLSRCMQAFTAHPKLSWVYAACERVNYFTQALIQKSTFYTDGKANRLFDIAKRYQDGVYILDSAQAVLVQLNEGLDNGLQNSVLRRQVTDKHLIPNFRVGEDRLFIIMALKSDFMMGFIDDIHVRYHVHDANISDTNKEDVNFEKRIAALEQLIDAKKHLLNLVQLNKNEAALHKDKLSKEMFWELGYSLYQASGDYKNAMKTYVQAIAMNPRQIKFYKTYMLCLFKRLFA